MIYLSMYLSIEIMKNVVYQFLVDVFKIEEFKDISEIQLFSSNLDVKIFWLQFPLISDRSKTLNLTRSNKNMNVHFDVYWQFKATSLTRFNCFVIKSIKNFTWLFT